MNKLATDSRFAGFLAAPDSSCYPVSTAGLYSACQQDRLLEFQMPTCCYRSCWIIWYCKSSRHIRNNITHTAAKEDWTLPPAKPLIVPCFWSGVAGASVGVLPGMTASQATVLVMGGRNVAAKVQGKEGYGMDWETRRLTEMTDEELLEIALSEAEGGVEGPQTKQDLEVIAILSAVNTAVTVMVLGFLYIIGRSRSGATLALKMMYPIDTWSSAEPTADFVS